MPKSDFFPTKTQPMRIRLIQSVAYWIGRFKFQLKLRVSEEDLGKIRALGDARVVLMPNHPTFDDGLVVFLLSAQLGEIFNYLVAYENFTEQLAFFLQKAGCYSIRRGLGDRRSITHTLELLKAERSRMVIFPEGGCSFQNDEVMPFRTGAIQLPFQAMQAIAKKPKNSPPATLCPLALNIATSNPAMPLSRRVSRASNPNLVLPPKPPNFIPVSGKYPKR